MSDNDLTIREIADELDISYEACRKRIARAGIKEKRWIGSTRVYDESVIEKLKGKA